MVRIVPTIVMLSLLPSCATWPQWDTPPEVANIIAEFYIEWDLRTGRRHPVDDFIVRMQDDDEMNKTGRMVVGTCSGAIHIDLRESYWSTIGAVEKELIIFHELGHCVLKRRHTEEIFLCPDDNEGCPMSMMHPIILKPEIYVKYREYYITELFERN